MSANVTCLAYTFQNREQSQKGRFIIEYMKTKDLGDVAAQLQFLSHGDKLSQFQLGTNTSNVPNILIEYKLKGVNLDIESSRDV